MIGAFIAVFEDGVDGETTIRLHSEPMAIGFGIVAIGAVIVILFSRFLAARTPDGGQALGMALAYRNTLRHVMRQAPNIDSAVATAQPRLPWIGTPDELAVWATALGLRKEIDDLFKRSLDDTGRSSSGWSPAWYVGGAGLGRQLRQRHRLDLDDQRVRRRAAATAAGAAAEAAARAAASERTRRRRRPARAADSPG